MSEAQAAGAVTVNYGVFINTIISFLIVAFAMFMLVRSMNKLNRSQQEDKARPFTNFVFSSTVI